MMSILEVLMMRIMRASGEPPEFSHPHDIQEGTLGRFSRTRIGFGKKQVAKILFELESDL